MNKKRLAIYLWPMLAWASVVIFFMVVGAKYHGGIPSLNTYTEVFFDHGWPYYTVPFLCLFGISSFAWWRWPNWKTFLMTIVTSWGLLGMIGGGIIGIATFNGFGGSY